MIYINLADNPPSKRWLKRAEKWTQKLHGEPDWEKKKKIIEEHGQVWSDLKSHLEKLSYGKCWFSEARDIYSYYHVEHFRPKIKCEYSEGNETQGYWWLSFDWKNYRICGSVGNTTKGNKFWVKKNKAVKPDDNLEDEVIYLLDPTDPDDPKKITFTAEGLAKPLSVNPNAWDYERAAYTIRFMGLNDFDRLVEERKIKWQKCSKKIVKTQELMDEQDRSPSATTKASIKENMEWFREKIAPCTELSATYKACLINSGLDWATLLVAENLEVKKYCQEYNANA